MKLIKSVVWVVILIVIVLISYNLLSNNKSNKIINIPSKGNKKEFINYYNDEIRRVVLNKVFDNKNPLCTSNCKEIYGIVNDDIDFEVLDIQSNYEVVYRASDNGKYSNISISSKDCKHISNSSCNGNIIKNYISKEWMK